MSKPLASLIISIYDNIKYLKVVLDGLAFQTDKRFEVIITEDSEHSFVKEFIQHYQYDGTLHHLTQPDVGWQKNRALNKAIAFANTDYLIFIDGDCVLHPRFIEFHLKHANKKVILAGKRIKLDPKSTNLLLDNINLVPKFQNYLLKHYFGIKRDGAKFTEEGIFINPNGVFGFIPRIRKMSQLKGCNMSFSKEAIYAINGFDMDFTRPAIGEDIDLTWRFEKAGYHLKSIRNQAVQYHLYHDQNWIDQSENIKLMQLKQANNEFVCKNGLNNI